MAVRYGGNISAKCSYLLGRNNVQKQRIGEQYFYILSVDNPYFEKLIGRQPYEVFGGFSENKASPIPTEIPLGINSVDAIAGLYGLSNGNIYKSPVFYDAVECICEMTEESAQNMIKLLKAAAILKRVESVHGNIIGSSWFEILPEIISITPEELVCAYRELRG